MVLPLLKSDIYDIFNSVATSCEPAPVEWSDEVTLGVVMASKGYPGAYEKGFVINGLDSLECKVYHMGTKCVDGQILTAGGRVLMLVGSGETIADARDAIYAQAAKVGCDNLFYRNDIAHIALECGEYGSNN